MRTDSKMKPDFRAPTETRRIPKAVADGIVGMILAVAEVAKDLDGMEADTRSGSGWTRKNRGGQGSHALAVSYSDVLQIRCIKMPTNRPLQRGEEHS